MRIRKRWQQMTVLTLSLLTAFFWISMPAAQAQEATGTGPDRSKLVGIVGAMPATGLEGDWEIGGRIFVADGDTVFNQEDGQLALAVCAEVRFVSSDGTQTAQRISYEEMEKCTNGDDDSGNDDPGDDDPGDDDPGDDDPGNDDPGNDDSGNDNPLRLRTYGLVETMPADGLVGPWTIGGQTYEVTAQTEFERDYGGFQEGACVKVQYTEDGANRIAREIESERAYKCGASGNDDPGNDDPGGERWEAEMYGVLNSFPEGLIGEWEIGGMTFVADANTEFDQERGAFAQGIIVKVHFHTDADDVNYAREIETKVRAGNDDPSNDDPGNDDPGNDNPGNGDGRPHDWIPGSEGHSYGQIEIMPGGTLAVIGAWRIGGVDYLATEETKFFQVNGLFAVDSWVVVKYRINSDGTLVARSIKTIPVPEFVDDESHVEMVGYVTSMPLPDANGVRALVGEWSIGTIPMTATESTKFKEVHGLLGEGAFVEVEFYVQDNVNVMVEIETKVPPGAGDRNRRGQIEGMGPAVAAAMVSANETWTVAGVEYIVTPATDVDESDGQLMVDSTVTVNSYLDADGREVATQIRAATEEHSLFLPFTVTR